MGQTEALKLVMKRSGDVLSRTVRMAADGRTAELREMAELAFCSARDLLRIEDADCRVHEVTIAAFEAYWAGRGAY